MFYSFLFYLHFSYFILFLQSFFPLYFTLLLFFHTVQLAAVDISNTFYLLQGKFKKFFKFRTDKHDNSADIW